MEMVNQALNGHSRHLQNSRSKTVAWTSRKQTFPARASSCPSSIWIGEISIMVSATIHPTCSEFCMLTSPLAETDNEPGEVKAGSTECLIGRREVIARDLLHRIVAELAYTVIYSA